MKDNGSIGSPQKGSTSAKYFVPVFLAIGPICIVLGASHDFLRHWVSVAGAILLSLGCIYLFWRIES